MTAGRIAIILGALALAGACTQTEAPPVTPTPEPIEAKPGGQWPTLAESGAWCWFADPRAITLDDAGRRTVTGWVTAKGDLVAGQWDHATGTLQTSVLRPEFERDDHANPSFVRLPDGRIAVFYTAHGGAWKYMSYRISERPGDVAAWGPERTLEDPTAGGRSVCYPNLAQLSAEENRLYLFYRGRDWKPTIWWTDDCETWEGPHVFIEGRGADLDNRPYCKFATNDRDRIDVAFTTGHPRNEPANSIYYGAYRDGAFWRADGTRIKAMADGPLAYDEAELVWDAAAKGARAWIWDLAIDATGAPVMLFAVCPEETDHRYHYARWDGSGWSGGEICRAGGWFPQTPEGKREPEPHYSGGAILDHADPSIVYLSRQVDGVFEIERWQTPDGGATWTSEPVTSGSAKNNVRPFVARGGPADDPFLAWMHGDYVHYTNYDTSLKVMTSAD